MGGLRHLRCSIFMLRSLSVVVGVLVFMEAFGSQKLSVSPHRLSGMAIVYIII